MRFPKMPPLLPMQVNDYIAHIRHIANIIYTVYIVKYIQPFNSDKRFLKLQAETSLSLANSKVRKKRHQNRSPGAFSALTFQEAIQPATASTMQLPAAHTHRLILAK